MDTRHLPPLTLAYTANHFCPSYTLLTEMVNKCGTNNNLHFLLVEYAHVHTADTAASASPRLPAVSDTWKASPQGSGTLPTNAFTPLFSGLTHAIQRKVKHPLSDRTKVIDATPFPPPNLQHLWSQPLNASATFQHLLKVALFPDALQLLITGTIEMHPPRSCNLITSPRSTAQRLITLSAEPLTHLEVPTALNRPAANYT